MRLAILVLLLILAWLVWRSHKNEDKLSRENALLRQDNASWRREYAMITDRCDIFVEQIEDMIRERNRYGRMVDRCLGDTQPIPELDLLELGPRAASHITPTQDKEPVE